MIPDGGAYKRQSGATGGLRKGDAERAQGERDDKAELRSK